MARHNELGKKGEALACEYLKEKGYQILETSWRYSRAEVDIIALKKNELVFIEVKTRSSAAFGRPEEFVTPAKERLIAEAAFAYLEQNDHAGEVRFDVIAILLPPQGGRQIRHFEDAFFPGF